jgi:alpha-beta hydrolase superfamily lysophospholipase
MRKDLAAAVQAARQAHPHAMIAVVGESMGAAEAIVGLTGEDAPQVDRVVLTAPAVWGWSSLPTPYALTLWTAAHTSPYRPVSPPKRVQRKITPSDNTAMLRKIGGDPLMIFQTRIDAVYGLVGLMQQGAERVGDLRPPTLVQYGAKDQIIPVPSVRSAVGRLAPNARTAYYAHGYHMLLRDLQAETVWRDILAFMRDPEAPLPSSAPPIPGARRDVTKALTAAER